MDAKAILSNGIILRFKQQLLKEIKKVKKRLIAEMTEQLKKQGMDDIKLRTTINQIRQTAIGKEPRSLCHLP
jgi:hypothetical protein